MQERIAAIRVFADDIVKGTYTYDKQDGSRVVTPYGVEIRRSVVIGHIVKKVVSKKEREYASITIDDGTETIQAKAWDSDPQKVSLVKLARQDALVLVVGRVKQIGTEVYIDPEIVRELPDPNYMTLHRLERLRSIIKMSGVALSEPRSVEEQSSVQDSATTEPHDSTGEKTSSESKKKATKSEKKQSSKSSLTSAHQRVLTFISEKAGSQGVSTQDIMEHFKKSHSNVTDIDMLVIDLLEQRKIREIKVGVYMIAG